MAEIFFSKFATEELESILKYISIDNPDATERFHQAAVITFQTLAAMPEMGVARCMTGGQPADVRYFRVKGFENYLIFYIPFSKGVRILHIFHGARNINQFMVDGESH